jgi:hypothetical protein
MNSVPQPAMKPEDRGVISDRIIGIFHWHNPFGRTMTLKSKQPLINQYQVCLQGAKAAGAYGWQPYNFHVRIV